MNILITGGTGFIGTALITALTTPDEAGHCHRVTVLTRQPAALLARRGELVRLGRLHAVSRLTDLPADAAFEAVVNLAGEGIADRPWTASRKQALYDSRVTLTRELVHWLLRQPQKPAVLVSGSAVGWYGNQDDRVLEETDAPHDEYVHQLCAAWEQAAADAEAGGIRVCTLRTGVVIGPGGGFLRRLLPVFSLGLGGPLGHGQQYLSWVSLADVVQVILHLLANPSLHGPFNVTGPRPVSNAEFTSTLAGLLRRPAFMRVPAAVIRFAMGEMSTLLLDGQRVMPSRLLESRYRFTHASLEEALRAALVRQPA